MKRAICFLILGLAVLPVRGEQLLQWFADVNSAQEKAQRENKSVLLDFTGSDWCGWCMKLKSEVFETPEFASFAEQNLVLVEVDFPRHKHLDDAQRAANDNLSEKYHISGYPTVILLDKDGQKVGETGYLAGGPRAFDANLAGILKIDYTPPQTTHHAPGPTVAEVPRKPLVLPPASAGVSNYYGSLALKGISGAKNRRLILINNETFMVGDIAAVKVKNRRVVICCKEIRDDSTLVTVDGQPVELKLDAR